MTTKLELQVKVSKMLALGFVLSIVGIGGLGSLAAMILGFKAKRLIKQSNGEIAGIRMAWWCIIVGALGTLILPPLLISVIIGKQK
ncbi:MAG TPA: hypothetical protein VE732_04355 [Nitrososphaera sp.]|jgi:hypothetical protein|nr:hypothetical protein [Nitrososphaera sp.]